MNVPKEHNLMTTQTSASSAARFQHPIFYPFVLFNIFLNGPVFIGEFIAQWHGPWWNAVVFGVSLLWLGYIGILARGASRGSIRRALSILTITDARLFLIALIAMTLWIIGAGWSRVGWDLYGSTGQLLGRVIGLSLFSGLVGLLFYRTERIQRTKNRVCANCGYDRKGDLWTPCPECGYAEEGSVENAA